MSETEEKNFYELLGLERSATLAEIKEAYREIARVLHPDSNYYDEIMEYDVSNNQLDLFKVVTAAYHTLISTEKRAEYDRTLPPDLKGWVDEDDEQAEIDAKLVELGLKDPSEVQAKPKKKVKTQAFGKFGNIAETEESMAAAAAARSSREPKDPERAQPVDDINLTSAKSRSADSTKPKGAPDQLFQHAFPGSANYMGVGRTSSLSGTRYAVEVPQVEPSQTKLYLLAAGVSFLLGIGLVALLLL